MNRRKKTLATMLILVLLNSIVFGFLIVQFNDRPSTENPALPTLVAFPDGFELDEVSVDIPRTVALSDDKALAVAVDNQSINLQVQSPPQPERPELVQSDHTPISDTSVDNQIVLHFSPTASQAERSAYLQSIGATTTETIDALNAVVVTIPDTVIDLPPSNIVLQDEADYYVRALVDIANPPSDPHYMEQWALPILDVPNRWAILADDTPQVTVAVIDSGICLEHPDLTGRILTGYDFVEDDNVAQDEFGHGCGVAGLIAANIDNGIGIAGVAPNTMVMPVRVLDAQGIGTYSDVAAGIVYAVDNGAEIINLSLGGANHSTLLEAAVNYAVWQGVTVVAAAGNTGGAVLYPAKYEPVIAVGALDQDLQISSFSANGAEVDDWAPGRNIFATTINDGYAYYNGTSFAAPFISAEVALGRQNDFDPMVNNPEPNPTPTVLDEDNILKGWLTHRYGDPAPDTIQTPIFEVNLVNDDGETIAQLDLDETTALTFSGQQVEVLIDASAINGQNEAVIPVLDIQFAEGFVEAELVGSKPFINVLCRFADIASVPFQPNEYTPLFENVEPGLDHYWRQISYGNIDIVGTTTINQWVELPQPRSYYVDLVNDDADLDLLAEDCAAAADSMVFYPDYVGINFIFNEDLDCCAWGGRRVMNLDGQSRLYSTTWLPPWAQTYNVIAHEMGHAFGLPHSSGPADNPPVGLSIYVSDWDVMSSSNGTCLNSDVTYGCWAPGTIGHHLHIDDWIPPSRLIEITTVADEIITLERLNQPVSTTNPLLVRVEIQPGHFYTVEARFNNTGYDRNIPGSGIIIHDVLLGRVGNTGPSLVVDADDGNDNVNDAGAMWTVGEVYFDEVNDISISVLSAGASSFTVQITKGTEFVPPEPSQLEVDALIAFYNSTNGASWFNNTNWLVADTNPCDWFGVFCDIDGHVIALDLWDNNLTGTLPPEIGDLTFLSTLGLPYNSLTGNIPAEIGNLTALRELFLASNQLTGNLPSQLGDLTQLNQLWLASNQFTGAIPTELTNLSNLFYFNLWSNQLTGNIPTGFGNIISLELFSVGLNQLTGTIPSDLGNLPELYHLYLGGNNLNGAIPASLANLSNLQDLLLFNNQLTGVIPSELGDLTALRIFDVASNQLTGTIPTELTNLSSLRTFVVWNNQLIGTIPTGFGSIAGLQTFNLGVNQLEGTIPTDLANLNNLQFLNLSVNQLTGTIPTGLGNLTNLFELLLSYNQLTGAIPTELGNLTQLRYLYLSSNQLDGVIPAELGNLTNLIELIVNENRLTGSIPIEIANLTNLNSLDVSKNALSGEILFGLGSLPNLNSGFGIVDFGYNSLVPFDAGAEEFLNTQDPDWETTQTIAPFIIEITDVTGSSFTVNWDVIPYTADGGYYEMLVSETSGEPYEISGCITADKTETTCEVTGLTAGTNYYVAARTFTPAHDTQQNDLLSDFSNEISATRTLSEYDALVALYNSTEGNNWFNKTGWLVDADVCTWFGITCDGVGQITEINLPSNNLVGTIPPVIGNFANLTVLDLTSNNLTGTIPDEVGELSKLVNLNLLSNWLSGNIPSSIGNLTSLQELNLSLNSLTGTIPISISNLTDLQELDLSFNQLTGNIPPALGALSNLRILYLNWNQLTGNIPVEIAQIQSLEFVYLYVNQLNGEIPNEFTTLPNLILLALEANQLTGTIPSGFGNSPSLGGLSLNENQLTGSIPPELGNSSTLRYILLDYNQLTGTIPNELASLDLIEFGVSNNQLTGTIPTWLGNQTNLEWLFLAGNQFTGELPAELGNLVNLSVFNVDRNALVGEIPQSITNLTNLDIGPINNEIDFGFNGLYTNDATVVAFLNENDPGWSDTQTIAPSNVQVSNITTNSFTVNWDAIPYTADGGYYEVLLSETSGAPYDIAGCITADKTETSCEVTGLTAGISYYVVVRTFTPAHDTQQNDILSGFSEEVTASTNTLVTRGDCNADSFINVDDLSAIQLEIFDGDSASVLDDISSGFVGDPIGCDANADTVIDAGDLSCTQLIIFDNEFVCEANP